MTIALLPATARTPELLSLSHARETAGGAVHDFAFHVAEAGGWARGAPGERWTVPAAGDGKERG